MEVFVVNYWAVLIAAIANMVVGAIWFGPAVFGKRWSKLTGINPSKAKKKDMNRSYAVSFVLSVVTAYVLAHVINAFGATTISGGLQAGFWMWLGFVGTSIGVNHLFEGKPMELYTIVSGHHLASLLIMGAIIASWV